MAEEVCTVLDNLTTIGTLVRRFRRSPLTITLWRKHLGLPFVEVPGDSRPAIRFEIDKVEQWAREHDKRMYPLTGSAARERSREKVEA